MILLTSMLFGAGVMLFVLRWIDINQSHEEEDDHPDEAPDASDPSASSYLLREAEDEYLPPPPWNDDEDEQMEPLQPNPYCVLSSNSSDEDALLVNYPEEVC